MVKVFTGKYTTNTNTNMNQYFDKYNFELSSFQKYAIEAVVEGSNSIVCAPTGSGKTLVADFAIDYFVSLKKKVIYTSPIKALSNQKFYEFSQKYKHISFGILTGDIKINPEADVLIMTAEILLNKLYSMDSPNNTINSFDIDFKTELACVVMDEVHYINDAERGHVWEETIIRLPPNIQMVMLSATLDSPENFARWVEHNSSSNKSVYLSCEHIRQVPLTHYTFITCNTGIFKKIKDTSQKDDIKATINKLHVLQSSKGEYNEKMYFKITNMLKLFATQKVMVKRQHVLNEVCKYMVQENMLPALCFVLSRKSVEKFAKEVTTVLLEDDSKVPYIVKNECETILRKLPNFREYLELPEYIEMVALLEKGIAIHHAGVLPILREMVEMLYSRGYIKLLFATETFSIGLNMPTKTVLFTDINKFDGSSSRTFYPHEYTQMAGRAGRRGIDTVGNVIHLPNLFKHVDFISYKTMMKGTPQILKSKFKISFTFVLNTIVEQNGNLFLFTDKSMCQQDINNDIKQLELALSATNEKIHANQLSDTLRTPVDIVNEYIELLHKKDTFVNKKKRECEKRLVAIIDDYKFIEMDKDSVQTRNALIQRKEETLNKIEETKHIVHSRFYSVVSILHNNGFVSFENDAYQLTTKGKIALQIREVHNLVFADFIIQQKLSNLTTRQIIVLLSCFTNINVHEELKSIVPWGDDKEVLKYISHVCDSYMYYIDCENTEKISSGLDYNYHYDLIDYMIKWCDATSQEECKYVIQLLHTEKGIEVGDFVKALLKINNMCCEFQTVAEELNDVDLLSKLSVVSNITLKYIVSNQSLYV
jgi:superfamily II RNA helicase